MAPRSSHSQATHQYRLVRVGGFYEGSIAKVFCEATRGAVLAALTEWRLQNAGWVRNVVAHDVKQEPIETATSPLWLRLQPNRFSLVIDFERLED